MTVFLSLSRSAFLALVFSDQTSVTYSPESDLQSVICIDKDKTTGKGSQKIQ